MKFGLFYLFSDFGDIPQDQVFKEKLDEIAYAEELRFDMAAGASLRRLWLLGNPLTFAAAIAQRTVRTACRRWTINIRGNWR